MALVASLQPAHVVYVATCQLREGVVIARADDFSEIGFVAGAMGERVTVDAVGNVYVGEVLPRNLKKFAVQRAR